MAMATNPMPGWLPALMKLLPCKGWVRVCCAGRPPLVILAHSIGSWIMVQAISRLKQAPPQQPAQVEGQVRPAWPQQQQPPQQQQQPSEATQMHAAQASEGCPAVPVQWHDRVGPEPTPLLLPAVAASGHHCPEPDPGPGQQTMKGQIGTSKGDRSSGGGGSGCSSDGDSSDGSPAADTAALHVVVTLPGPHLSCPANPDNGWKLKDRSATAAAHTPTLTPSSSSSSSAAAAAAAALPLAIPPPAEAMTSARAQAGAAPKPPAILKVVLLMPFLQAELRSCTRQRWLHFLARRWHLMGRLAGAINRLPVRLQEAVIAFFVAGMDKDAVRVVRLLLSRPCVENAFYMANCEGVVLLLLPLLLPPLLPLPPLPPLQLLPLLLPPLQLLPLLTLPLPPLLPPLLLLLLLLPLPLLFCYKFVKLLYVKLCKMADKPEVTLAEFPALNDYAVHVAKQTNTFEQTKIV
ncbi:hypothetical protein QJQ45_013505 [Haematococcus lacustris]|nr:hypothetical protein QJQ45_013505 [Haematococcus lacustris]